MRDVKQLWLPKVGGVKRIKRERKTPEPQIAEYQKVKRFEILHHPFDLRFRGRIYRWLEKLKKDKQIQICKVLTNKQARIVRLYFYPQKTDKKWLTQVEIAKALGDIRIYRIRSLLVESLMKIWNSVLRS